MRKSIRIRRPTLTRRRSNTHLAKCAGWFSICLGVPVFANRSFRRTGLITIGMFSFITPFTAAWMMLLGFAVVMSMQFVHAKRLEIEHRITEDRYRVLMELASDAVITTDSVRTTNAWNPRAETKSGQSTSQALGRPLRATIIPSVYRKSDEPGLKVELTAGRTMPLGPIPTSRKNEDIERCYKFGCNSFMTKPARVSAFTSAVRDLSSDWFRLVALPSFLGES